MSGQLEQHDSLSGSEVSEAGSSAPYRRTAGGTAHQASQQRPRSSCSPGSPIGNFGDVFSSVADPDPGSGIGCFLIPGSGIRNRFFPDPGSRIPDLGSRIPDPKTIFLRAF